MPKTTTQSYAKHAHTPKPTGVAGLFGFIALVLLAYGAFAAPTLQNVGLVCVAFSVIVLVVISRWYTVGLQDRIIRLEMQLRLDRLGRAGDFGRLSTPQLVALRFGSDEELPGLIDRVLTEKLTPDQIKRAVTNWQADLHRT
ncbi:MAG: DUF6526 family protein [Vicinamibacterales bacterium]